MLCGKDIPLLGHGDMCIYLRNVNRAVPQHLLYVADIDIRLQKTCRKSVPEHMRRDVQINCRKRSIFVNHPANGLVGQFPAVLIGKEMTAALNFRLKITLIPFQDLGDSITSNLYPALLGALPID